MERFFADMLNRSMLTAEQNQQFDNFLEQYKNKSDREIYGEIERVKNDLSDSILEKHIRNLDHLSKMEGFVTNQNRRKIETIKRILTTKNNHSVNRESDGIEAQYVSGSSLLLWFLTLVAIWPRGPYYRRPRRRRPY